MTGWQVIEAADGKHVVPVNDRKVHMPDRRCWCEPTPDAEDPNVVVHHSVDRREMEEGA